jgi:SpoIID/LytB domain protein
VGRARKTLSVVNSLPLDEYVRGVVGGEMPDRWRIAALEAQAVAARSYALATLKPGAHFDLYGDTRSQVYGGIAYETARTNIAVERTAGKVLTWNGRVATTYFFSTSGGRTADVHEVWPRLPAVPYLRATVSGCSTGASPASAPRLLSGRGRKRWTVRPNGEELRGDTAPSLVALWLASPR